MRHDHAGLTPVNRFLCLNELLSPCVQMNPPSASPLCSFGFSGLCRILVTRQTSEIYSGCPAQQPDSNSSSSRGKECRLSGGLGRVIGDPVGGSEVVALLFHGLWKRERERGVVVGGWELDWLADTHGGKEGECWWGCQRGLKVFGLVPVEPTLWHAEFQEINTMVFPFTPPPLPTHIHHPAAHPDPSATFFSPMNKPVMCHHLYSKHTTIRENINVFAFKALK